MPMIALAYEMTSPTAAATLAPIPEIPEGKSVPKVIHQIFFPGKPPAVILENIARLRDLNPGWEYRLYNDTDMLGYISRHFGPDMLACYERIDVRYGAARADFFRYLLMYREGGVYLDVKSGMTVPLDQVIRPDDRYLLSRWDDSGSGGFAGWGRHRELRTLGGSELVQWHIVAAPGHPYLRAVIDAICRNIASYSPILHGTGRLGVLRLTGPIAYTQAIMPILTSHPHRFVSHERDLRFIYSIFGDRPGLEHHQIFARHYSQLTEPVVVPMGGTRLIWPVFRPLQNFVLLPFRRITEAISRRLGVAPRG